MTSTTQTPPLVVAFVNNMMFTSRIANVLRHLNYRVEWIEHESSLREMARLDEETARQPGEVLGGRMGALQHKLTEWQPALLIFDLSNDEIPWASWMAVLKTSPATRRIPILAFGPHEDGETMKQAQSRGANRVVARSKFFGDMAELIQAVAHIPDYSALAETCAQPLSPFAQKGIALFNEGEYFECHEYLEVAWKQDQSAGRDLYRGILQIAVAYLQIERGNYRGAAKMFLRARQWLEPLPPICRGVHVEALRINAEAAHAELLALGQENLAQFDRSLFKPVTLEPTHKKG